MIPIKFYYTTTNIMLLFSHADIDECAEGTDGCVQTCTDTKGSYVCSCGVGYRLANDSHGCNGELISTLQENNG